MAPTRCTSCNKNFRSKTLKNAHKCTGREKEEERSEEEEVSEDSESTVTTTSTENSREDRTERRRPKKKYRLERRRKRSRSPASSEDSSTEDSSADDSSAEEGGIRDRNESCRVLIPRSWPRSRRALLAAFTSAEDEIKESGPPSWVLRSSRMLRVIASHVHHDNKLALKKRGRPHPAAESVFIHFIKLYIRSTCGEKAERCFKMEVERLHDTTSKSGLRRAIAKAKNADVAVPGNKTGPSFHHRKFRPQNTYFYPFPISNSSL